MKKKVTSFLVIAWLFTFGAFGQSIERKLVGNAGETFSSGGLQLCCSLGEVAILPSPSAVFDPVHYGTMFTIGFQQPHVAKTGSLLHPSNWVSAYPNPTTGWVRLDVHNANSLDNAAMIIDASGRQVAIKPFTMVNGKIDLNLGMLPAGTYTVVVIDKITGNSATTQIIKMNK